MQACWYKGETKISDSPQFWHSTANGVCTLVIPTCAVKDVGEYTLVLENPLGSAKSSCNLVIFGKFSGMKRGQGSLVHENSCIMFEVKQS